MFSPGIRPIIDCMPIAANFLGLLVNVMPCVQNQITNPNVATGEITELTTNPTPKKVRRALKASKHKAVMTIHAANTFVILSFFCSCCLGIALTGLLKAGL